MKITALEYFITLAESSSINEAAQKLYIAQPSLTKALQCLEQELGFQLFTRSKAGIELTEAGRTILPEARQVVSYYKGWMGMGKGRKLRTLDIYTHVSFSNFLLPDVILKLKQSNPELVINCMYSAAPELHISSDTEAPTMVILPYAHGANYQKLVKRQGNRPDVLFQGEYVCLVNQDSPLATKAAVSLEDLKNCYLALPEMDMPQGHTSLLTPLLDGITAISQSRQIIQVESVSSVIDLVVKHTETYALSYYPALCRYNAVSANQLACVPFSDVDTRSDYCLFYSKQTYDQYPLFQTVVSAIHQAADKFLADCANIRPMTDERFGTGFH